MNAAPLNGLVAAAHTPFLADGSVRLAGVEAIAAHLLANGVTTVFVNGSTAESSSLTLQERLDLAARWTEVAKGTPLRLVIHVGANCVDDARTLAAQAEQLGASAVSAVAPSYFKPRDAGLLADTMASIAAAAPETPFYYYDIPALTGLQVAVEDFLRVAPKRIPNLVGVKFTNPDLMAYQFCLRANDGRWDLPWGVDEHFLGALAMGARGAVGSGFNFAAPIYRRLMEAFARGDLETARTEQFRGVRLIRLLAGLGYLGAAKAVMGMLGVDVGPARLPNTSLDAAARCQLQADLEQMGFFDWIR